MKVSAKVNGSVNEKHSEKGTSGRLGADGSTNALRIRRSRAPALVRSSVVDQGQKHSPTACHHKKTNVRRNVETDEESAQGPPVSAVSAE